MNPEIEPTTYTSILLTTKVPSHRVKFSHILYPPHFTPYNYPYPLTSSSTTSNGLLSQKIYVY